MVDKYDLLELIDDLHSVRNTIEDMRIRRKSLERNILDIISVGDTTVGPWLVTIQKSHRRKINEERLRVSLGDRLKDYYTKSEYWEISMKRVTG